MHVLSTIYKEEVCIAISHLHCIFKFKRASKLKNKYLSPFLLLLSFVSAKCGLSDRRLTLLLATLGTILSFEVGEKKKKWRHVSELEIISQNLSHGKESHLIKISNKQLVQVISERKEQESNSLPSAQQEMTQKH
jgi:hypothetical protein